MISARKGKPSRSCRPCLLDGCAMELSLADVLNGLIGRAGSGQSARVQLRVRELPGERNVQALDIAESVGRKELLARTRPAERHHHRLIADLLRRGKAERCQRPGSRRRLQVTPHGDPGAPAGPKDPVYLGNRVGCGAPDPPEAGDDVERRRIPRQGVHIADPDVAFRVPVPGHRDQPGRGIDTRAGSAAEAGQLDREPGPARHVEQPVSGIDAEPMVHRDVLPAVARLAEGREVHRLTAPALVHHRPLGKARARPRHRCSLSSSGPRCAGLTGLRGGRLSGAGHPRHCRSVPAACA